MFSKQRGFPGIFFWVLAVGLCSGISGCNLPASNVEPTTDATVFAVTAEAVMTQLAGTALSTVNLTQTQPAVTPTAVIITTTPRPGSTIIPTLLTEITVQTPCDLAAAGIPLDVTIPDDSRMLPGESFTKTWRLVNRGTCAWTRDYALVWFSGELMGASRQQQIPGRVNPGETVDVSLDMVAPREPGLFTSYWMLRNANSDLFGIGPGGNSPFWVRIQVVAVSTLTPTITVTPTVTPVTQAGGTVELSVNQTYDLDHGQSEAGELADLILEQLEEALSYSLRPINNARVSFFGSEPPGLNDCRSASLDDLPIVLEEEGMGGYYCYRTNQGLPGRFRLTSMPTVDQGLVFEFITWFIP